MADIVQIYVHSAPNPSGGMKYFYDQNLQKFYGWGEGTVAFKAYAVPRPGAIPIYVHTAGLADNPRYYYDGSEQNDFGWSVGSVSFYAYASEQPGTIPIYCH